LNLKKRVTISGICVLLAMFNSLSIICSQINNSYNNLEWDANVHVMNQEAEITLIYNKSLSDIESVLYLKGTQKDTDAESWSKKAKSIKNKSSFQVSKEGNYSIRVTDKEGNKSIKLVKVQLELKGVWISYLDFTSQRVQQMNKKQFQTCIDNMFKKCESIGLNTLMVQVRPFGDAFYPSKYFPWSQYISGQQGKNPGYDPLTYMVEAAHKRNIKFYAWLNPYRVSTAGVTDVKSLSKNNQARVWRTSSNKESKRNVLTYMNQLFYNPSKNDVQNLIVNGVKEIVENYEVDGIVFDDYFYPNLGNDYKKNFDYVEYNSYKSSCTKAQLPPKSIVNWRRDNVSSLLKKVKSAIKSVNENVVFGVSPQGNLGNLKASNANYVDVEKWINSKDYIDFISPQIYWSFTNSASPFGTVLDNWLELRNKSLVNVYSSLAVYKAGMSKSEANKLIPPDKEWAQEDDVLQRQVEYGRESGLVDGFILYRYDNLWSNKTKSEMENLKDIM